MSGGVVQKVLHVDGPLPITEERALAVAMDAFRKHLRLGASATDQLALEAFRVGFSSGAGWAARVHAEGKVSK